MVWASKNSLRGLDKAISFAKQSGAEIIGVHRILVLVPFLVRTPILPPKKWKQEAKKLMSVAKKKYEKSNIEFEGVVIGGHTSGIDLTTFAMIKLLLD